MTIADQPDLSAYARFVVAFSGGKDSLAALLHLLDHGIPPHAIELHHHHGDGQGPIVVDWPCTAGYVAAIADHFSIPLYASWREGGFAREMDRSDTPTAPIFFETPSGLGRAGGNRPAGTRGLFPQISADLRQRWCSPSLKIDVLAAAIRRHSRHHWRPIHTWTASQVWAIIGRRRIRPHPAYCLGWGRLSCRCCIFGSADQWATLRAVFPDAFAIIAQRERASGKTIHRRLTIDQLADLGAIYPPAWQNPDDLAQATDMIWRLPITLTPWALPAGAMASDFAGPT